MGDKYTWGDVMALCREARRHRDLEVRSAILADLVKAIDEVDKDKEAALESAFREEGSDDHHSGDRGHGGK